MKVEHGPGRARQVIAVVAVLTLAMALSACGSSKESGSAHLIRFGAATPSAAVSQFQLWLPEVLGYWDAEGVTVDPIFFPGNTEMIQSVVAGNIDAASGATGPLLDAVSKQQPVIGVFTNYTSSFYPVAVPADSHIQRLQDLRGKVIGVSALTAGQVPLIKAQLQEVGVQEDEVEFVSIGTAEKAMAFYDSGRIDAFGLWDAQYYTIDRLGLELRVLPSDLNDRLGFQHAITIRTEELQSRREDIVKLLRGVAKAREFADENPAAAARLFYQMFPESRPAGVSEADAIVIATGELKARMEYTKPVEDVLGYSTAAQVQEYMDILVQTGNLDQAFSPSQAFTDELLDEVNDFDREAIRQQARDNK